jgi:hypothetical protein
LHFQSVLIKMLMEVKKCTCVKVKGHVLVGARTIVTYSFMSVIKRITLSCNKMSCAHIWGSPVAFRGRRPCPNFRSWPKCLQFLTCKYHSIKKQSRYTPCGAWGERRYSSYSFLTSALDRGEWSASRPGRALPQRKDPRYPLYRRLGGPQSRSGHRG